MTETERYLLAEIEALIARVKELEQKIAIMQHTSAPLRLHTWPQERGKFHTPWVPTDKPSCNAFNNSPFQ